MADSKTDETQTLFAVGIVIIIVVALWYVLRDDVTFVVGKTRQAYLWVFSFFTDEFERIRAWLGTMKYGKNVPSNQKLDWSDVKIISVIIGNYMRWPVAVYFLYCMWWAVYKTPRRKYRTVHNLASFLGIQARVWPVIKPIVNFNPGATSNRIPGTAVPQDLPLFAEALSPEEWIAHNGVPLDAEGIPGKEGLRQAFTRQLGPRWAGMRGLKDYHQALIAAFALKGAQKRRDSDDLLGAIAGGWSEKSGFVLAPDVKARIKSVLNDDALMTPALEMAGRFAYRTTALLGILSWARERGGVLAPAQFLWLRGVDRNLWYPLNNLGRRSFHAEAAGAMAHFMAEQALKRGLPVPRVDNAIPVIVDYMRNKSVSVPPIEGMPRDNAKLKLS